MTPSHRSVMRLTIAALVAAVLWVPSAVATADAACPVNFRSQTILDQAGALAAPVRP